MTAAPTIIHTGGLCSVSGPPYVTFERRSDAEFAVWVAMLPGAIMEPLNKAANEDFKQNPCGLHRFIIGYFGHKLSEAENELLERYDARQTDHDFWRAVEAAGLAYVAPEHAARLDNVPPEMRERAQWVVWRRETRAGKTTKVPYRTWDANVPASSTDPATWASFAQARASLLRDGVAGVGYVFSADDPYTGVDLDDCIAEGDAMGAVAAQIMGSLDTYTEISPSGKGLHCILRGGIPERSRKQAVIDGQAVEVYDAGRYFCMTGNAPYRLPLSERQAPLEELLARLKKAAKKAPTNGGAKLGEGQGRNNELTRLLGIEVANGVAGEALRARAYELNDREFDPPLEGDEVETILGSAGAWEPGEADSLENHAAHTAALAQEWRGQYRWSGHEGSWRRWTGKVWKRASPEQVAAAAQKTLRKHYGLSLAGDKVQGGYERLRILHKAACNYASVTGGLSFLKGERGFHTEDEEWDPDDYLLNCENGIYDLKTRTFRRHDPDAMCTMVTRWKYDEDEPSTGAWQRQLDLGIPNLDLRRQIQRDLGRALCGATLEHSLPIWYGEGRNTKSTLATAVFIGLGDYAHVAVANLLMATNAEQHPTEIAELSGKRVVFSDEINQGKALNEARVKDLTGGGRTKRARFMRKDNFDMKKTQTYFLLVNHLPTIAGTDKGIWGRLREVPWKVSIPPEQQREMDEVVDELVEDGAWMLRWLIAGWHDFREDPHWIASEVKAATDHYRATQDQVRIFLDEESEKKPTWSCPKATMYAAYAKWCADRDENAISKNDFGTRLRKEGLEDRRGGHGGPREWVGIRLKSTPERELSDAEGDTG